MSAPTLAVRPAGRPLLPDAVVGVLLFIGAEVTLFAGLCASFVVLRSQYPEWPPPGQPRLPAWETAGNTAALLLSGLTISPGLSASRAGDRRGAARWLGATLVLGALFLVLQGREWVGLVARGLTLGSGVYGAIYYFLVGVHALHVLGAVAVLAVATAGAARGRVGPERDGGLKGLRLYWWFVVAVWPVLYALLYQW